MNKWKKQPKTFSEMSEVIRDYNASIWRTERKMREMEIANQAFISKLKKQLSNPHICGYGSGARAYALFEIEDIRTLLETHEAEGKDIADLVHGQYWICDMCYFVGTSAQDSPCPNGAYYDDSVGDQHFYDCPCVYFSYKRNWRERNKRAHASQPCPHPRPNLP